MRATLRRIRAHAVHFALLAVLSLGAGLLFGALPRAANDLVDRGLRQDVAALPHQARDLVYRADSAVPETVFPSAAAQQLSTFEATLPAVVRDRWFAADVGPADIQPSGPPPYAGVCRPELRVRHQTGIAPAVRLISGRLPASGATTEVIVDAASGTLQLGSRVLLNGSAGAAPITVVGVFEPAAPASPFWDDLGVVPVMCPDPREGVTSRITLLTDVAGITRAGRATGVLHYEWRYAPAVDRLSAADLTAVGTAVAGARRAAPAARATLVTDLDRELAGFAERLRGVQALLTVVRAGLAAVMLALIVLAAGLMVDRRGEEFALLRARGAATSTLVTRTLRETAVVVPAAVLTGWALGHLVPGRADPADTALAGLAGLVALLAAPLLAARPPGHRSRRRFAAELLLVLLAVLGVVLVRHRGPVATDLYLASVPVLLSAAVAVVAARLMPWPLRQAGRVTVRARGVVAFLGLARAGRSPAAGPFVILVVAIATGVFTAAVDGTIGAARDRATDLETAADAQVDGFAFAPETGRALAAVPGVRSVVPVLLQSGAQIRGASGRSLQAQLLVTDGGVPLPPHAGGAVPAVVSPQVAAEIGAGGTIEVQGRRYEFRVASVAGEVPVLPLGTRRFVALPWQALPVPADQPLLPTRFLVTGDGFAPEALRVAGDEGQRANLSRILGHPVTVAALPRPATVTTWAEQRAALERGGVNGVLAFTYAAGAAGATAFGLLAVGLTVLAGAAARGRALDRLRTMGLSPRQGRWMLVVELTPVLVTAFAAGATAGVLLPGLLEPALNLTGFSAGVSGNVRVDPWLPGAALVMLVAALGVAVLVEGVSSGLRSRSAGPRR